MHLLRIKILSLASALNLEWNVCVKEIEDMSRVKWHLLEAFRGSLIGQGACDVWNG